MLAVFDTPASLRLPENFLQKNIQLLTTALRKQLHFINVFFKNPKRIFFHQNHILKLYAHRWFYTVLKKWSIEEKSIFIHKYTIERINKRAMRKYRITEYKGIIDLFKAKKRTYYLDDPKFLGWKPLALKGLMIHEVNTDHNHFFDSPHVKELAGLLQDCLDKNNNDYKQQDVFQNKRANLIAV
jgi:hypothetical protein